MTKEATKTATKPGERIFFDTSGPFKPSAGGSRYWVKAIDDMHRTRVSLEIHRKLITRESNFQGFLHLPS